MSDVGLGSSLAARLRLTLVPVVGLWRDTGLWHVGRRSSSCLRPPAGPSTQPMTVAPLQGKTVAAS